jgi:large subunit ribosomal protein L25
MEQIELRAEPRTVKGKQVRNLREQGLVPAILYGSQVDAAPIQIESKALHKVLARAGGNTLISLQIGDDQPVLTLAREIQRDIIRHNVVHVDFYQVVMTEKINAEVPIVLTGKSPAVEEKAGVLVHGLNTVEVHCLPADLPSNFRVDLSSLTDFNDLVAVSDLQVPSSITILSDPDSVIVRIEAPRMIEEEIEEAVEEVELPTEPKLIRRVAEAEGEETEK